MNVTNKKMPYFVFLRCVLALCLMLGTPSLTYAQPPVIRIMPLGDSITYGVTTETIFYHGYRQFLDEELAKARQNAEKAVPAGSLPIMRMVGTQKLLGYEHDGYNGWRLKHMNEVVENLLQTTRPDIILLHLGTNDVLNQADKEVLQQQLELLLDHIHHAAPQSILLVATVIPLCKSTLFPEKLIRSEVSYNEQIKETVARYRQRGDRIMLVDMYGKAGITCEDIADGIHPTRQGYHKIATAWKNAISLILDKSGY